MASADYLQILYVKPFPDKTKFPPVVIPAILCPLITQQQSQLLSKRASTLNKTNLRVEQNKNGRATCKRYDKTVTTCQKCATKPRAFFFFWFTRSGVFHGLEGHDARVLRDDRPVEIAEAVHVLRSILEVSWIT